MAVREPHSLPSGVTLVVIPCLNEAAHIESVLAKITAEMQRLNLRIVVADGGSVDGTRDILVRLATQNRNFIPMDNPKRIQSAAVNTAVCKYGGDAQFLIRVDAHGSYPDHYCEQLLEVQSRTHADSVVVSMQTVGHTCFERAAAAAQNSTLGNGGAAHRNEARGSWVDHGHHALMTMEAFTAVGGYDETFSHNEDVELDARLKAAGFHIYLSGETQIVYYPRGSMTGLFQQYFKIGQGRARNFLQHDIPFRVRHIILVAIGPILCLALLAPLATIFAVPAFLWALLCLSFGVVLGIREQDGCAAASGFAAMAMQVGWSFGFIRGLCGGLIRKRRRTGAAGDHGRAAQTADALAARSKANRTN